MVDAKSLEYANARGVGQFHIFEKNGLYARMTWHSLVTAQWCAERHNANVVNSLGRIIYRSRGEHHG